MKLTSVDFLKENDMIAEPVMSDDLQILLGKGTLLKKEYILKLKELGIDEVYIEDGIDGIREYSKGASIHEIKEKREEIKEACANQVRKILKRHIYRNGKKLSELRQSVNEMLDIILSEPGVVKCVYEIQQREPDIYEHTLNVCSMSMIVGLKMKLEKKDIKELGTAAMLHDLGLRYTTVKYENKELSDLPKEEQEEYKKHTIYGYTVLFHEDWLSEQEKNMILYHHENLTGGGYPLHMEELSVLSQILSVCDIMDEMICGICYKKRKIWEVLSYLENIKGVHYYDKIIDTICSFIAAYPKGTRLLLNDGSVGVVVKQNENSPKSPIIQIISSGSRVKNISKEAVTLIDLEKEKEYYILKVQER